MTRAAREATIPAMNACADLARYIDHTLLHPAATAGDIRALCAEAVRHGFVTVCVNPLWVSAAAEALAGSAVGVCSVVGFPLGATTSGIKALETEAVCRDGAGEIDMVLALGWLKGGEDARVRSDVQAVVQASAGRPVKVILETHLLTDEEKTRAARLCVEAGAAFVKTCTGFSGGGATEADVALLRHAVGRACGVKASGGIRTAAAARRLIAAGATRLGTRSGIAIVTQAALGAAGLAAETPGGLPQPGDATCATK